MALRVGFEQGFQYWCRNTSPHEVSGAQWPLSQADFGCFRACFCFLSRGPDPLRGGGRAPTYREIKNARPDELIPPRSHIDIDPCTDRALD